MSELLINDMINQERGRKREILLALKKLNWEAFQIICSGGPYKQNYYKLMKTDIWKKGKKLLIEYVRDGNENIICDVCGECIKEIPIVHHLSYRFHELLSPPLISLIHKKCHKKGSLWSRK